MNETLEIRYRSFSGTFYISIILQKPQYIFIDTLFQAILHFM